MSLKMHSTLGDIRASASGVFSLGQCTAGVFSRNLICPRKEVFSLAFLLRFSAPAL